jgi:hypothetical protein
MEKINMTLSEKINASLEKELEISMQDEDFKKLVKRTKLPKDVVMKNNTKLTDTCDELKNCKNCKGLFMCKNKVEGHVLYPSYDVKIYLHALQVSKRIREKRIRKEK